jgi:hypothetical protein
MHVGKLQIIAMHWKRLETPAGVEPRTQKFWATLFHEKVVWMMTKMIGLHFERFSCKLVYSPMLWLFKYFRQKMAWTISFCKIFIIILVYEKNATFFRRKLTKIAENCDHSIEPQEKDISNFFRRNFAPPRTQTTKSWRTKRVWEKARVKTDNS